MYWTMSLWGGRIRRREKNPRPPVISNDSWATYENNPFPWLYFIWLFSAQHVQRFQPHAHTKRDSEHYNDVVVVAVVV